MSAEEPPPLHPADAATIQAFVIKEKKQRYLEMLANSKKRAKFLDGLNHCSDLDERFTTPVCWHDAIDELRKRGAPDRCHIISSINEFDGIDLPLAAALLWVEQQGWGTIICCIPGQLAYYYDECGFRRLILERKSS